MIKIGLTGGIGSGKSVVAVLMEMAGIPVYIADTEGKRLTATSPVIRDRLTALYGESLYSDRGLDKKKLASIIFSDKEQLRLVNSIIHPVVRQDFLLWAERQGTGKCAIESAILFESGLDKLVDISVMVYAPLEMRIGRVAARDGATREEILRRMRSQMPDEEKQHLADITILNDGRHALIPQLGKIISCNR